MRRILSILALWLAAASAEAQSPPPTGRLLPVDIVDGDTMPRVDLRPLNVFAQRKLGRDRASLEYIKLARKVCKVYPYVRLAVELLDQLEDTLALMDVERAKRRYVKELENALVKTYKADLVRMTVSEGRIMMKLVDRETGNTTYSIIRDTRGGASAFFWQSIARLFGETLKAQYDPTGDDRMIEEIVLKIENGQLEPLAIPPRK